MAPMESAFTFPASHPRVQQVCDELARKWQRSREHKDAITTIAPPAPKKVTSFWKMNGDPPKTPINPENVHMGGAPEYVTPTSSPCVGSPMDVDGVFYDASPFGVKINLGNFTIEPKGPPPSPTPASRRAYRTNKLRALQQFHGTLSRKNPRELTLREQMAEEAPCKKRKLEAKVSPMIIDKQSPEPPIGLLYPGYAPAAAAVIVTGHLDKPNYFLNAPTLLGLSASYEMALKG
ncbi:hypothetical protein GGS26DRAFT_591483 [Hypomontagnella submonticulosa]|nr:hypothetical protein GGS26DRAFT_591483 [Hypomontagnella submonticulosa]